MKRFLRNILQLVFSPDNGWGDIVASRGATGPCTGPFVRYAAIVSLSWFMQLLYGNASVWNCCVKAVVTMVAIAASYMLGSSLLLTLGTKSNDGVKVKANEMTCYLVAVACLQMLLTALTPIPMAIYNLWPVYVMVIAWRGYVVLGMERARLVVYLVEVLLGIVLPLRLLDALAVYI